MKKGVRATVLKSWVLFLHGLENGKRMRMRSVALMVLLVGILAGCETTTERMSSIIDEEQAAADIMAPVVEKEEVVEPAVAGSAPSPSVAEATELKPQSGEKGPPQVKQSVSPEMEKTPSPPVTKPETSIPAIPISPTPTPQKAVPSQPIEPKNLQDIYFDFDEATILAPAKPILEANATLLQTRYSKRNILIEGHCDERGSVEYNLVLGVRRAQVAKAYLEDLGVPRSRIRIVSYGKERPVCNVPTEICWQKNRRAHFVLQ